MVVHELEVKVQKAAGGPIFILHSSGNSCASGSGKLVWVPTTIPAHLLMQAVCLVLVARMKWKLEAILQA